MLRLVRNSLLSLIYPGECKVCSMAAPNVEDGVACRDCWINTRIFGNTELLCDKCGIFLGDETAGTPAYCHRCAEHYYDRASALGIYEHALAASIIALKTSPNLASRIVDLLQNVNIADSHLLIPVPLSKLRLLERGFNQAEIIAGVISRSIGVPVDGRSLVRTLHTPIHRVGMDDKARDLTVRNAFAVVRPKLILGKNILLVDDVMTSGATASHCAKLLKKHGANQVNVFTLARAVMR